MSTAVRRLLLWSAAAAVVIAGDVVIAAVVLSIVFARHQTVDVAPPLAYVWINRDHGRVVSIDAGLRKGQRLDRALDLTCFDGFDSPMRFDDARRRFGPPAGYGSPRASAAAAEQEQFRSVRLLAPYYDRPGGRVFLRPYRTLDEQILMVPMAFPRSCTADDIFVDPSLRSQIATLVPPAGFVSLTLHGGEKYGRVVVSLSRNGCSDVLLSSRDSSPPW